MKRISSLSLRTGLHLAVFQLGLLLCPALHAAVTFTITPAAVSNTYNGAVTLQVSGLTNTETVVVQKFLDLNSNGVVDASDWLVQQFKLTDGQAGMVMGGVTNINVPGDTSTTAGQITAKWSFRNGDFIQNIAGQYAFLLSSPGGHFAPVTSLFGVTNVPYAQKFTGNVISNGTSTTLPNAIVLLFGPPRPGDKGPSGGPLAGAVANNSGSYTIPAPPGTYTMPMAFKTNYVFDFSTLPTLTLSSGQTVTTNLTMTKATSSISGKVVDANNASKGLPGLLVTVQATNGFMGVSFTDTNGNFTVGVQSSPSQWRLGADDTSLIVLGYPGLQDRTNANAGQTGVTLAMPKATALFYGSVRDNLGNPLAGLDIYAEDDGNRQYESDGYTDANGNYTAAALAGDWRVQISNDTGPTNYIFAQGMGQTLTTGQAAQWNVTAVLATNHISGSLRDPGGNPIAGVGVWAGARINGVDYNQGSVDTDSGGNYWLNVANGTWTVGVDSGGGDHDLPGNYLAPADQSVVIANNNGTVNFTALAATNHIAGHVQQGNGTPIGYVGVWASARINSVDYFQYVDADSNGNYSLNVANGSWMVGLETSGGGDSLDAILGNGNYQSPDNQNITINNNNGTANFTVEPMQPLQMTTVSLANGTVGVYYEQSLSASGGQQPYWWWLPGGTMTLPPGAFGDMDFSNDGTISGIAATAGTFSFWVGVYDNASPANVVTQLFSITIQAGVFPLEVTTAWLPNGTNGAFYSQTLQASGGQPPYKWSIPNYSAELPANLILATNGVLSGTFAATVGSFFFDVEVTDGATNTASQTLSLAIVNPPLPPLVITNVALPGGTVGAPYSAQLGAAGGQPPHSWNLALGSASLPAGLELNSAGLIFGTPTTNKVSTFRVQATDANFVTTNKILSIVINSKPVLSAPNWLGNQFQMRLTGAPSQNYTVQMSTNLSSSNWTSLLVTNSATTNAFNVTDRNATNKQRFYRVQVGP